MSYLRTLFKISSSRAGMGKLPGFPDPKGCLFIEGEKGFLDEEWPREMDHILGVYVCLKRTIMLVNRYR